jgi:hypothetical protein
VFFVSTRQITDAQPNRGRWQAIPEGIMAACLQLLMRDALP